MGGERWKSIKGRGLGLSTPSCSLKAGMREWADRHGAAERVLGKLAGAGVALVSFSAAALAEGEEVAAAVGQAAGGVDQVKRLASCAPSALGPSRLRSYPTISSPLRI